MAKKTQGTELWFLDPDTNLEVEVGCVTSINGIGASRDQIETTCLDSTARTYEAGLAAPGAATFGINFDPADESHVRLHELYTLGTTLQWALGWSDGTVPPDGASGGFDFPTSRSWLEFEGYINDVPFDFALNAVVASTVAIQVSDFPILHPKTS
jgi:hypothetical protein